MNATEAVPRVGAPSFICPHCKAFAQQEWLSLLARRAKDSLHPVDLIALREMLERVREQARTGTEVDYPLEKFEAYCAALFEGYPYVEYVEPAKFGNFTVSNMHISSCYVCKKPSIWVAGRVVFPETIPQVADPNGDLPPDIRADYREAAGILANSPRAAAALLRLAIQKLCSSLLERDGAINEMIGDLVSRGLSPIVQRALDVVRVIGNEAVHPGTIDLRDDHGTALQLFGLVNLIAEAMISQPKHVMELYGSLPADKIAGIEQRDAKARRKLDEPPSE